MAGKRHRKAGPMTKCPHGKAVTPAVCRRFHDPKEVGTMAAKKKARRPRQPAGPMPEPIRRAAAAAIAMFEERMMDQEGTGFISASSKELVGNRSGMVKRIKVEDEDGNRHTAVVQVTFK